jgi:PAS domain S-box-containing protein
VGELGEGFALSGLCPVFASGEGECSSTGGECPLKRAARNGTPYRAVHSLPDASGPDRLVESSVDRLAGVGGKGGVLIFRRDVTDALRPRDGERGRAIRETFMDVAIDAVLIADAETGCLVEANERAEELFERPRSELIGLHQSRLFPVERVEEVNRIFREHVAKGSGLTGELEIQTGRGRRSWVSISARLFELEGRRLNLGVFRDVTEQTERERGIERDRALARSIVDAVPEPLLVLDGEGRVEAANAAFLALDPSAGQVLGSPLGEIGEGTWSWLDAWIRTIPAGESASADPVERVLRAIGKRILSVAVRPLPDFGAGPGRRLVSIVDATSWRRLERELADRSDRLERLLRHRNLFVDLLRHDLLNVANVIASLAEVGGEADGEGELRITIAQVGRKNAEGIRLLENASLLARLEDGERLGLLPDDLGEMLGGLAAELRVPRQGGLTPDVRIVAGSFPVLANPLLADAFRNLVANALNYGPAGGPVEIEVESDGGDWIVTVADRGPGIPDERKVDVFERFLRLHRGAVRGQGLGLAIAKAVVEAHGGRIWVEDNPGGGSRFRVRIAKG